jgi:hypothetical protein
MLWPEESVAEKNVYSAQTYLFVASFSGLRCIRSITSYWCARIPSQTSLGTSPLLALAAV